MHESLCSYANKKRRLNMAKILAFSGSLRHEGNTDTLLKYVAAGAEKAGAEVELVFLREYAIQPCIGCEKCRQSRYCANWHDGMDTLYPKIEASHAFIIGSPVHNYNITAILKAFIDRLYPFYIASDDRPRKFSSRLEGQGRKVVIFAVGEQTNKHDSSLAIPAMALPLTALGYSVVSQRIFMGLLEKKAAASDKKTLNTAFKMGEQLGSIEGQCESGNGALNEQEKFRVLRFPYV
jgi:multimeric flavodoxin WrbA